MLNPGILTFIKKFTGGKIQLRDLGKFVMVRPSIKYAEWEKEAVNIIAKQAKGNLYIDRCEIHFRFYFGRLGRSGGDTDNKTTTMLDVLTKAGIIRDDSYDCVGYHTVRGVYRKGKPGVELIIKDLSDD